MREKKNLTCFRVPGELQQSIPWWNTLREILKHHPDFPQWDEQLDRAHDDEDDAYRGQRGEGPQQEAPMQGELRSHFFPFFFFFNELSLWF